VLENKKYALLFVFKVFKFKNRVYFTFYNTTYVKTVQKHTVFEQVTQLSP